MIEYIIYSIVCITIVDNDSQWWYKLTTTSLDNETISNSETKQNSYLKVSIHVNILYI